MERDHRWSKALARDRWERRARAKERDVPGFRSAAELLRDPGLLERAPRPASTLVCAKCGAPLSPEREAKIRRFYEKAHGEEYVKKIARCPPCYLRTPARMCVDCRGPVSIARLIRLEVKGFDFKTDPRCSACVEALSRRTGST
jgi:hypothetical protein